MGIAYLVVSWLLLQVVDVVAPMLALPDWAAKLVLLLLAIGFPVALLLAWAFELTPEGVRREEPGENEAGPTRRRAIDVVVFAALAVVLGYVAVERLSEESGPMPVTAPQGEPAATDVAAPAAMDGTPGTSIAVLPFLNLSGDPEQEYFSDGISEELLTVLSRVPGLRVASRTSAFAFKGENRNLRDIASILEVNHILEGSVRKAGNRVRITVQLIDAANDRHLWSETYDRELTDIFAIQDEISTAIVDSLSDTLGVGAAATISVPAVTENMDAYDVFLQATSVDAVLSIETRRQQVELLERAVELDPGFARGWTALAIALNNLPTWDHSLDVATYTARAREAAERSLAIDPDDPGIHLTLATIAYSEHDWFAWREHLAHAGEVDAALAERDPFWVGILAQEHLGLGYIARAQAIAEAGLATAPDNSFLHLMVGISLLDLRRPDEALPYIDQAITLGYAGNAQNLLWHNYAVMDGRDIVWTSVTGEAWMNHDPDLLPLLPHARRLVFSAKEDRPLEIRRFWRVADELGFSRETLLGPSPRWGPRLGVGILLALGEYAPIADHYWGNTPMFWMWEPGLQRLRRSDAFEARVRESGMLAFWKDNGWPDLCRPVADDDFECD